MPAAASKRPDTSFVLFFSPTHPIPLDRVWPGPSGLPLRRCWPAALPGAWIVSLRRNGCCTAFRSGLSVSVSRDAADPEQRQCARSLLTSATHRNSNYRFTISVYPYLLSPIPRSLLSLLSRRLCISSLLIISDSSVNCPKSMGYGMSKGTTVRRTSGPSQDRSRP